MAIEKNTEKTKKPSEIYHQQIIEKLKPDLDTAALTTIYAESLGKATFFAIPFYVNKFLKDAEEMVGVNKDELFKEILDKVLANNFKARPRLVRIIENANVSDEAKNEIRSKYKQIYQADLEAYKTTVSSIANSVNSTINPAIIIQYNITNTLEGFAIKNILEFLNINPLEFLNEIEENILPLKEKDEQAYKILKFFITLQVTGKSELLIDSDSIVENSPLDGKVNPQTAVFVAQLAHLFNDSFFPADDKSTLHVGPGLRDRFMSIADKRNPKLNERRLKRKYREFGNQINLKAHDGSANDTLSVEELISNFEANVEVVDVEKFIQGAEGNIVIDIREEVERKDKGVLDIKNAQEVNIDFFQPKFLKKIWDLIRGKSVDTIYMYCANNVRATLVADFISRFAGVKIVLLKGGLRVVDEKYKKYLEN